MTKRIFNKRWIFFIVVFSLLIAFGIGTLDEDFWLSVAIIIVGSLLLLGYAFVFPNSYRIDENSITVYYGFGIKTAALWNELKCIEDHPSRYGVFPWFREYHIGYFQTKFCLWEKACIPKNKKTKTQMEKYCGKTIEKLG